MNRAKRGGDDLERMIYTVCEIAVILGIGKNAAYDLMHQEGFPSVRVGRRVIVPKEAFARWLDEQAQKAG